MAGRVATIAFLAAFLVGCATKVPAARTRQSAAVSDLLLTSSAAEPTGSEHHDSVQRFSDSADGDAIESTESPWRPQFEINFATGLPMGEFADQVNDSGLGVSLLGGVGLPSWPVVLGAEFCFLNYGRDSDTEIVSTSIGDVEANVTTTNDIIMGHLLLRIQPRSGPLRPYLDGLFGFKNFSTDTRVTVPHFDPDDPFATTTLASKTQLDDTALSYGAGAGLDIRLKEWTHEEGDTTAARLNLGARYLFGSRAKYLKKGSVRTQGDEVVLDVLHSRTDMLIAQIGLSVEF